MREKEFSKDLNVVLILFFCKNYIMIIIYFIIRDLSWPLKSPYFIKKHKVEQHSSNNRTCKQHTINKASVYKSSV